MFCIVCFIVEFSELFTYSQYKSFIRYVFCQYFPRLWLVFSFLVVPFEEQGFLILMTFSLSVFLSWIMLSVTHLRSLPNSRSQRFSPTFSSRNFAALRFTFRAVIYFQLIFTSDARYGLIWRGLSSCPTPFVEKTDCPLSSE